MSWTSLPAAGAKLRGSVLTSAVTEVREISSRLTSDTAAVTNNTLVASGLSVPVEANKVYDMYLWVLYNGLSTAADMKIGFTYPTGATAQITPLGVNTADAGYNVGQAAAESTSFVFGTAAASDRAALLLGQWVISSTAGTIVVMWAQNTTTAVNSVLRSTSRLILRQQE